MLDLLMLMGRSILGFVGMFDEFEVIDGVTWLDMIVVFAVIFLICSIFLKTGSSDGGW